MFTTNNVAIVCVLYYIDCLTFLVHRFSYFISMVQILCKAIIIEHAISKEPNNVDRLTTFKSHIDWTQYFTSYILLGNRGRFFILNTKLLNTILSLFEFIKCMTTYSKTIIFNLKYKQKKQKQLIQNQLVF